MFIYPIVFNFWYSFFDYSLYSPEIRFVGLENYVNLVKNSYFQNSVYVTLMFLLGALTIEFSLGLALAHLLHMELKFGGVFARARVLLN
jgi:multiple sugar transport system permease protein